MTTALDRPIGKAAEKLIAKFGKAATLTRIFSVHDPVTGTTDDVDTETPIKVLVEQYSAELIDGTSIRRTDRRLTIAARAVGFQPTAATSLAAYVAAHGELPWGHPSAWDGQVPAGSTLRDVITIGGESFNVQNVEPVYSGEDAALFTVQGRR